MVSEDINNETRSENIVLRKLQNLGKSSIAITIPKKWIQKLGLKVGDYVVLKLKENAITIKPCTSRELPQSEFIQEVHTLNVHYSNLEAILRKIIGLYVRGVNILKISFTDETQSLKPLLKTLVRSKLPGAEVIDERMDTITFRFMPIPEDLSIKKLLNRMSTITCTMLNDGLKILEDREYYKLPVIEDFTSRESEVDRLYLLVYRLVNQGVSNIRLLQSLELYSVRELVASLTIAKFIERCADHVLRVCEIGRSLRIDGLIDEFIVSKVVEFGKTLLELHKLAVTSFINSDVKLAMEVLDKRPELRELSLELMGLICTKCSFNKVTTLVARYLFLFESLRRFLAYSYDIAETTVNTYAKADEVYCDYRENLNNSSIHLST